MIIPSVKDIVGSPSIHWTSFWLVAAISWVGLTQNLAPFKSKLALHNQRNLSYLDILWIQHWDTNPVIRKPKTLHRNRSKSPLSLNGAMPRCEFWNSAVIFPLGKLRAYGPSQWAEETQYRDSAGNGGELGIKLLFPTSWDFLDAQSNKFHLLFKVRWFGLSSLTV